jgi:glyoxylase-like metal-dependent hydrolase (beta-lactamase superfamily II)
MNHRRLFYGSIKGPIGAATPFNGYLIDHPKGLTLVDTGFGSALSRVGAVATEPVDADTGELVHGESRWPWVRRTTLDALADHGVEAGDVKYIINTHLGDHSGDNHFFPEATFIVQKPEIEWVRRTMPHGPRSLRDWDFPGAKFELLGGEDVEVLPGLTCVYTPGHTPGHQAVVLDHPEGKIVFCGDAVYTADLWQDTGTIDADHPLFPLQVLMGVEGLETWRNSAAKLTSLDAIEVHFAHDRHYMHGTETAPRPIAT